MCLHIIPIDSSELRDTDNSQLEMGVTVVSHGMSWFLARFFYVYIQLINSFQLELT
jgi:hypothetical protein